jgi:hypothetical protein
MYKIIIRSIFYHWFALFIGLSIGFICHSEWVGTKAVVVERSIRNIFFPIQYDENVENFVKSMGQTRLWIEAGKPDDFKIIDDLVKGEEFYWAIYTYKDESGNIKKAIGCARIRWKTWEYYYKLDEIIEGSEIKKVE